MNISYPLETAKSQITYVVFLKRAYVLYKKLDAINHPVIKNDILKQTKRVEKAVCNHGRSYAVSPSVL